MPTPADELQLIEKAATGDSRAFQALLAPYQNKMRHLLGGYFKHSGEADEAMQEVLIRVFRGLKNFRGECKFSTWVYTVTSNTARNELERNRRHYNTTDIDDVNCADDAALHEPDTVVDNIDARQRLEAVRQALSQLPAQMAEALLMREVQHMSDEQIADAQGCPTGTVRSRIFRARQALKAQLLVAQ